MVLANHNDPVSSELGDAIHIRIADPLYTRSARHILFRNAIADQREVPHWWANALFLLALMLGIMAGALLADSCSHPPARPAHANRDGAV